jgi:predicted nucleic acid-binding protein
MIVVSNTSPLTNLAAIGELGLLRELYGDVHIPLGVRDELSAGGRPWPGRDQVLDADWIHPQAASDQALLTALQRDLDQGESEAIVLALQLGADVTLMDEYEGRRAAQRLGLAVIGVIGVLLEAKHRGLVPQVHPTPRRA